MSGGWTPGPWKVGASGHWISAPECGGIGVASAGRAVTIGGGSSYVISNTEAEANARLIAAAPDLLAALEKAQEYFDGYSTRDTVKRAIAAAIAKATGEETNA